jgi:hypothetical protein
MLISFFNNFFVCFSFDSSSLVVASTQRSFDFGVEKFSINVSGSPIISYRPLEKKYFFFIKNES